MIFDSTIPPAGDGAGSEKPSAKTVWVPQRPELSEHEEAIVLRYAAKTVFDAVIGDRKDQAAALTAKMPAVPVWGVFVSLKNAQQLRACCGHLEDEVSIAVATERAAQIATRWDLRFPAIQPAELPQLHLEVWILWNRRRVEAEGEERLKSVEIGKHGVQIAKGQQRGLLLPGVAVEHRLDARQFLEHVCRKAGLAATAWLDPSTELFTFEGYALSGAMAELLPQDLLASLPSGPGMGDLVRLTEFARQNLRAMAIGATPSFYTTAAFDGPVQGIVLTLKRADRDGHTERVMEASRVFPQGSLPLQATLMDLLQGLLAGLRGHQIGVEILSQLRMGMTILTGPRLLGTAGDCDLRTVDPRFHALCAVLDRVWAVRYAPQKDLQTLLEETLLRLHMPDAAQSKIFALSVLTSEPEVEASNVPKPVLGPAIRPPAVAGQFYPGHANAIDDYLSSVHSATANRQVWSGAIVPHAGWKYSGQLAVRVWEQIQIPSHVIIVAPKHHAIGCDWAVAPHETWALPGLSIKSDRTLAQAISETLPFFQLDAAAHAMEHAIEVQLPMLARFASAAKVVGIVMRGGRYESICEAAKKFAEFLRTLPELPLLVISTDMNHYADETTTRQLDHLAIEALESCDPERLWTTVRDHRISMCGIIPAVFVMATLRELGRLEKCRLVGYTTSAAASGDTSRVVGYLGALFE
ncbi:MAG: AmmeMemoRadiSam system protein B [Thermogutta sp.]